MSPLSVERRLALVGWGCPLRIDKVIAKLSAMPLGGNGHRPRAGISWTPPREHGAKIADNLLKNPGG